MSSPESGPAPEQVETPESKLKMSEVLKRQDDIKNYFHLAYEEVCFDFEKAARKTGFSNRNEADSYLSVLTGSNYGSHLKTGDRVVAPDGREIEYIATAREALEMIKSGPDFLNKDLVIIELEAFAYAERLRFPLSLPSDLSRNQIYTEIVQLRVFEMPDNFTMQAPSGRKYAKKGGAIYFNSNPEKDKIWGRLDGGDDHFVLDGGNYMFVVKDEFNYDEVLKRNVILFVCGVNKKIYDGQGNYSEEWTKSWSW